MYREGSYGPARESIMGLALGPIMLSDEEFEMSTIFTSLGTPVNSHQVRRH